MRWLLALVISVPAIAQPAWIIDAIERAKTPADLQQAVNAWARGRSMGSHSATWDGSTALAGLMEQGFDRDTAAFDWDGGFESAATPVIADVPRYGHDEAVFGARTLETVNALTGSWRAYCAGTDANGLPTIVANYRGTPTIYFYRGGSSTSVLNTKTLLGGSNKPATAIGDILNGETDEEADFTHDPRGAFQIPGLTGFQTCTHEYDGDGDRTSAAEYDIHGVGFCYSTDNGASFELGWRSDNLNSTPVPTDYGSEWSITVSDHDRDGSDDDYWGAVATYSSGVHPTNLRTADFFVFRLTGGAGSWSVSNAHKFTITIGTQTHVHCAWVAEDPNNPDGLKVIVLVGDGQGENKTLEYLCSSKDGFLTGASAVSNSANVVSGGSNWSGPVEIEGSSSSGTMASQVISLCAGQSGGVYGGVDEGLGGPILHLDIPATDGARPNWSDAYRKSVTTRKAGMGNWRCFGLTASEHGSENPAVVGHIFPGNGWDSGNHDAARFVFKPAGEDAFGIVYAPQDEESMGSQLRPVIAPDGYIYFGSGNAQGLRRFAAPTSQQTRIQKGIYAGPGGNNIVLGTPAQWTAPTSGNTVTVGTETPPAAFPSAADVMHFTAGSSTIHLGHWRLTDNAIDKNHSTITVQLLAYQDTNASDADVCSYFRHEFYTVEGTISASTGFITPQRIETRGGFVLATFVLVNGVDWDTTGFTDSDGLRLIARPQSSTGSVHPGEWWQKYVGVYVDQPCPPSYFVPDETNGDHETITLSGFTCTNRWSGYAIGLLGGDTGRDTRHPGANTFREIATFWESSTKHIQVAWDADDQIRIVATDGGSTDTETITGLPKLLHGDPFIFAMNYDGTDYTYALSVAGTVVMTGTIASPNAVVLPTRILPSQDDDGTVRETCRWFYAGANDAQADSNLSQFVRTLRAPSASIAVSSMSLSVGLGL